MSDTSKTTHGETPGSRQAMDRVTQTFIKGGMDPREAQKKSVKLAIDWDRRNRR